MGFLRLTFVKSRGRAKRASLWFEKDFDTIEMVHRSLLSEMWMGSRSITS